MDRQRPHHVALPAIRCHGHNYITLRLFCEPLSLRSPIRTIRRDGQDMIVFCFAEPEHAQLFRAHFGGELLDHQDQPKRHRLRTRPADIFLEDRQRNGRCINCAD